MSWLRTRPLKALIIFVIVEAAILLILLGIFIWLILGVE